MYYHHVYTTYPLIDVYTTYPMIQLWHMREKSFPKFIAVFEKTLYLYCLTFFPSSFFFFFSLSSFIWYAYLNHITSLQRDKWWSLAKSHADQDSEFSDFAIKNSKRNGCILMDFENYLFLFIQFFISYHKIIFYKVSNGSVEVDFRL